jgi:acylpyruvate hydrolase
MNAKLPSTPVVFLKPSSALLDDGGTVVMPAISRVMHHEVELVVLLGSGGKFISRDHAMDHVAGYAVGLDMTLRDVQAEAKKHGLPWSVAKGFDTSAPVSKFVPRATVPDPSSLDIALAVNGTVRQSSNTRHMLFSLADIIAYLSTVFTLEPGDLIFTGTPEGVGPVARGDTVVAQISSVGTLTVGIR